MELAADELDRLTAQLERRQDHLIGGGKPFIPPDLGRTCMRRQTIVAARLRHVVARIFAGR
jgi:hypothetical protein